MVSAMDRALVDELPEHSPPEPAGGGRPRLRRAERRQVELRAVSLDQLVAADHRVRLVVRGAFVRLDRGTPQSWFDTPNRVKIRQRGFFTYDSKGLCWS